MSHLACISLARAPSLPPLWRAMISTALARASAACAAHWAAMPSSPARLTPCHLGTAMTVPPLREKTVLDNITFSKARVEGFEAGARLTD